MEKPLKTENKSIAKTILNNPNTLSVVSKTQIQCLAKN